MKIPKVTPHKLIDPVVGGSGRYFQLPLLEGDSSAEEVASIGNPGVASFNPEGLTFTANVDGSLFELMLTASGINRIVNDSGLAPGFEVVDRPTLNLRPAEVGKWPIEQVPISCLDYLTDIASGRWPVQAPAFIDGPQSTISQRFSWHDRKTEAHILAALSATGTQAEFVSSIAQTALDFKGLFGNRRNIIMAAHMIDAVMIDGARIRTGWPAFERFGYTLGSKAMRLWLVAGALSIDHSAEEAESNSRLEEITRYIQELPRILNVNNV